MIETRILLINMVYQAVYESNPEAIANGFDSAVWLDTWLMQPLPALGWIAPTTLLKTTQGQALITKLLGQALEGSYS